MTTTAFETAATTIKTAFDQEFVAEGYIMVFDQLHPSLGEKRVEVGIAPVEEGPMTGSMLVEETTLEVRFYDLWSKKVDPRTAVNPVRIVGFAERFKRALQRVNSPSTPGVWYFDITRIRYPDDPTGNKTRFVATIRCRGNNSNLIETTG